MKNSEQYKVVSWHVGNPHEKHVAYFEDYGKAFDCYINTATAIGWCAWLCTRDVFGRWVVI